MNKSNIDAKKKMIQEIQEDVKLTSSRTSVFQLSDRILQALEKVPRHEFVGQENQNIAYLNQAVSIGEGQTISQPFIVALMTQLLDVQPTDRILEIGTGSGYQAAILSLLTKEVYSVEVIASLSQNAQKKFQKLGYKNIHTLIGNGVEGWPGHAPYQGIIVTASATEIPAALFAQLDKKGRLVIPLKKPSEEQVLTLVMKDAYGNLNLKEILPVVFVPFV